MRGQDIANKVLPGLGYIVAFLISLGGLAFNIGNIGGASINDVSPATARDNGNVRLRIFGEEFTQEFK